MTHRTPDLSPSHRLPYPPGPRQSACGLAAIALLLLAGCASPPPRPSGPQAAPRAGAPGLAPPGSADPVRDGPGSNPPPDLHLVPDAQPRLEPVRSGGPNKPYEVLGQAYTPLAGDPPLQERGLASWYGNKFHGRGTATGETYNMYAMTAAHKTMPLPSYARVRNPANGREVVVRVNDRGPFHSNRVIDLSYTAALRLGVLGGVATVEIERITYEAIRTGAWRAPALPGADDAGAGSALATAALLPETAAWLADDAIAEIGRRAVDVPVVTTYSQTARQASARTTQRQVEAGERAARTAVLPPETRAPAQAAAKAAPGFWLQLGAFSQHDGAVGFQQRVARELDWLAPLMAIFNERKLHRLQAGPYASRADAVGAADRVHEAINLVPAIVERR
jgi:rare lipoprotein A